MNTWVAMQLLPGIIYVNSWVAMQLLLKHHAYKQLGCHATVNKASFIYTNAWVAMQLFLEHHLYIYINTRVAMQLLPGIMHINSWVAMQLLLEYHVYKYLSCHAAITRHDAYKQLGCHAAVTRALCTNISSLVGLELAYGHGSSSNHNSLVSGVIKQLNDTDFTLQCSQGG